MKDYGERPETAFIPFDRLRSFSRLYRDYMAGFERLSGFYVRNWRSPVDRRAAVTEAAAHPRDRETLVTVLREQQELWGADPMATRQVERLLDPRSAVVVTGQQVGLFTGPLYTVLKAMTTVRLARRLEEETGHPVVPVFWLGSEDHDFHEMSVATLPGPGGPEELVYRGHTLPSAGNLGSVGGLEFTDAVLPLVDRAESCLAGTEFSRPVMDAVRAAYAPGVTFRDAFARLLRALLPGSGLVLMSADDVRLKRLALPLWKKDVTDPDALHGPLAEVTARLEAEWHAQVRTTPTDLFIEYGGSRLPIDREDGAFRIRGTDVVYDAAGLCRLLEEETGRFTPNVVLRPLTQDWLLPTAAYVAGPGEIAYFAQFGPAYAWAGLPMPVIHPRATVTIIEPRVQRVLERVGLSMTDFDENPDTLFTRVVVAALDVDLEARFAEARSETGRIVDTLRTVVQTIDPGMDSTVDATSAAMDRELDRMRERVLRGLRRRESELRSQVTYASQSLFPGSSPQERVLSPLWFAARFGPGFLPALMERIDVFADAHHVMRIDD